MIFAIIADPPVGLQHATWHDRYMQFMTQTIGNMVGIWVATLLMTSISFARSDSFITTLLFLFVISAILTALNYWIRPFVKVLTFPFYILTLGLFAVVTNGIIFGLTAWVSKLVHIPLVVNGNWSAILGGTITAIVASAVTSVIGKATGNTGQ